MPTDAASPHILSIVVPALNEEGVIGETIRRCLEAREHIVEDANVAEVEVIVVSDGSTDRTESIACEFPDVTVLGFEHNRGYGVAIKTGFEHARGDLLGFLDADGTCDPRVFSSLCEALDREQADVVLGSRMGPESEMPRIRTIGNILFAWLLGILSRRVVHDTASGMRVVRRAALPLLYPLPDGLHFTPAMSARILLEDELHLVEVPMAYRERQGASKLSVIGDGIRFLSCIVQAAMCYRPARPLLLGAGVLALGAFALGAGPVGHWLRHGRLEEWMIYRVLLASLLITMVAIVLCAAVLADRISALAYGRPPRTHGVTGFLGRFFTRRGRRVLGAALGAGAVACVGPGIVEFVAHGSVQMHWSRAVLASLLLVIAVSLGASVFILNMMTLIRHRRTPLEFVAPPDRVRRPRSAGA